MRSRLAWMSAAVVLGAVALLAGGCAAPRGGEVAISRAEYPAAFTAAREVLREAQFEIDRVDGRAGVISTLPRRGVGIAPPWDPGAPSLDQRAGDVLNRDARRVRVTFAPAGADEEGEAARDLLADGGGDGGGGGAEGLVMRVRVLVEREQRPGWRLESSGVQLSTRAGDPEQWARGMSPAYAVVVREDEELSGRLAERIARRVREPAGQ